MSQILSNENYKLDLSTSGAFQEIIEGSWDFDVFSVRRELILLSSPDDIFNYFLNKYPQLKYRIFYGVNTVMYCDEFTIRFGGELMPARKIVHKRFDDTIVFTGKRETVIQIVNNFDVDFADFVVADHHTVEMVMNTPQGLEYTSLPIKANQKFYPSIYPQLKPDPETFIDNFIKSPANVLILMGEAGMGKSALINQIILSAEKRTQVVYDKEVMASDQLYTNFISRTLQEDGGIMIMEDADNILSSRIISENTIMSKLLNLSDGIIDTSGAKFIFSANIKDKGEIDHALIRPGRCFDIVEFTSLSRAEAEAAANEIGIELKDDKNEYTVAELFTGTENRHIKKNKVGFI